MSEGIYKRFIDKQVIVSNNVTAGFYFFEDTNTIIMNNKSFVSMLFRSLEFNKALETYSSYYINKLMTKADILFSRKFPHEVL
ncbi:MAG TPA: hypothetical protein VI815_02750 [Candidatus Nanoarchaeia archaeon]|nr:hypothetical protein [Candidatus Nanoarchaeia archaeon]